MACTQNLRGSYEPVVAGAAGEWVGGFRSTLRFCPHESSLSYTRPDLELGLEKLLRNTWGTHSGVSSNYCLLLRGPPCV